MAPPVIPIGERMRLDTGARRLEGAAAGPELKRKAIEILCELADAQGETVTKDELLERVWSGQVVEENNLQVHVSALRRWLEQHAGGELHIVTMAGKGYRLLGAGRDKPSASERPVIAVLPFETFGSDEGSAWLAHGMSEEIAIGLARVRWLSVVGGSSIAGAREPEAASLARRFSLDYFVQGSVRRDGAKVRVAARLTEAAHLTDLWSERFECDATGVFELQDDIAARVVSAIEPGVAQAELARIHRKRPADLRAHESALRAQAALRSLMPDAAREALTLLSHALALDPGYAWAIALQAWCHHVIYSRGGLDPREREAAVADARRAVAQGGDDPLVLATCGLVLWFDAHEAGVAFELFDRALALSPSNFLALAGSSVALSWSGQAQAAQARAEQALRLNPLHPLRYLAWQGLSGARLQAGDAAGARAAAAHAVESNAGFSIPLAYLCAAQWCEGDEQGARDTARRLLALQPDFRIAGFESVVGVNAGVFSRFAKAWRSAGLR